MTMYKVEMSVIVGSGSVASLIQKQFEIGIENELNTGILGHIIASCGKVKVKVTNAELNDGEVK